MGAANPQSCMGGGGVPTTVTVILEVLVTLTKTDLAEEEYEPYDGAERPPGKMDPTVGEKGLGLACRGPGVGKIKRGVLRWRQHGASHHTGYPHSHALGLTCDTRCSKPQAGAGWLSKPHPTQPNPIKPNQTPPPPNPLSWARHVITCQKARARQGQRECSPREGGGCELTWKCGRQRTHGVVLNRYAPQYSNASVEVSSHKNFWCNVETPLRPQRRLCTPGVRI